MRPDLVEILACPTCNGPLELTVGDEADGEVVTGSFECAVCSAQYPIVDTIPILLSEPSADVKVARSDGEVSSAYDHAAPIYFNELATGSKSREMLEKWSHYFAPAARVVDIGAGAGRTTRWLEGKGYAVLSVDLSMEMLRRTREGRPGAWLALADMRNVPVVGGGCDALTAFFSLGHISKAGVPSVLSEFNRVVRPGGAVIISVRWGVGDEVMSKEWTGGHVMHFSDFLEEELGELLAGAYFRTVDTELCSAVDGEEHNRHLFTVAIKE